MSAWIVSKPHIDALVQEMIARDLIRLDQADATGRELWEECRRSVAYRYPNDTGDNDRPGPVGLTDERMAQYEFEGVEAPLHPEAIAYACNCYEYQSCEHPGWEGSRANALTSDLHMACCLTLGVDNVRPPYERWPWGIDDINDVIDRSQMGARG
jgi:hypothetical protein